VESNIVSSPGHTGRIGDRFTTLDPASFVPSPDKGDYGVAWNESTGRGFVWANLDHASRFAPGQLAELPTGTDP
jgi:hypothetical protein